MSQLTQVARPGCRRLLTPPCSRPIHPSTSAHAFSDTRLPSRALLHSSLTPSAGKRSRKTPGLLQQPPGIKDNQSQPLILSFPRVLGSSFELQGDPKKVLLILTQGVKLESQTSALPQLFHLVLTTMVRPAELPKTGSLLPPEPATAAELLFRAAQVHLPSPGHSDQQNAFPGLTKHKNQRAASAQARGCSEAPVPLQRTRAWCAPQSFIKHDGQRERSNVV